MLAELLSSARFSCAAFGSWKILVSSHIIMLEGLYPRADRMISPQYYLLFLLSLLSVAYTQFTYWLVSVVLNTSGLSGLWRERLFCEHVKSQLQVTNIYRHFAIGAETFHFFYTWKMNVLSDIAIGCRILYVTNSLSLSLSLSHTHTHTHTHTESSVCVLCLCAGRLLLKHHNLAELH